MKTGKFLPGRAAVALALMRREYAIQFAGMSLGLAWPVVQYLAQIGVFLLVFGRGIYGTGGADHYAGHLISGMLLWLPLSEMLSRSVSILSENRALIRRTTVGRDLFPWIPAMQAVLQYFVLSAVVASVLGLLGHLSRTAPLAFGFGLLVIAFFSGWSLLLSRAGVLLRDLSPLMQPALQAIFWLTPIAYFEASWSLWNPLTWIFSCHETLWLSDSASALLAGPMDHPSLLSSSGFLAFSALVFSLGVRLKHLVEDHL